MNKKSIFCILICTLLIVTVIPATGHKNNPGTNNHPFKLDDGTSTILSETDEWSMFRHDLQHTGFSTSQAPNAISINWSQHLDLLIDSSPAIVDNVIFIGTHTDCTDGKIFLLNASDGSVIKMISGIGHIASSPIIYDEGPPFGKYLYVGSEVDDFKLYCYWIDTPEAAFKVWEKQFDWSVFSSPAVDDGRVFVSHSSGFYCFDAHHGGDIWYNPDVISNSFPQSSPAVENGKIYVGTAWGNIHERRGDVICLNASDGTIIWTYQLPDPVESSPAISNGKIYVGSDDNNVYCLDAEDGHKIWNFPTGADVVSSPSIAYENVYVGSCDGKMYCLNANTGEEIWSFETGHIILDSPAVADGKVYIGSHDTIFYCLNAEDGRLIWSYSADSAIFSSPAIGPDGRLYMASIEGILTAFDYLPNNPPNVPHNPEPVDDSTGIDVDSDVSWTGGDPDPEQYVTYDVYFGTSNPPPLVLSDHPSESYDPGNLEHETQYYWQIVARDGLNESSSSTVWSFTTGEIPPELEIGNITGGFGVSVEIKNIGAGDAYDIEWGINFNGGFILIPNGGYVGGTIDNIPPGEIIKVKTGFIFGFGKTDVTVDVESLDSFSDHGFILGPFVFL